jgi:uncharacterized protein (TIGR02246 family)
MFVQFALVTLAGVPVVRAFVTHQDLSVWILPEPSEIGLVLVIVTGVACFLTAATLAVSGLGERNSSRRTITRCRDRCRLATALPRPGELMLHVAIRNITSHSPTKDPPMQKHSSLVLLAVCCLTLLALDCNQQQMPDTRAADEAAIRSINPTWFKAYNAGDANAIVALYANDAVVNAPGVPAVRGQDAIREFFTKEVASAAAAGMTQSGGATTDAGVSGDLGWEWGTYTVKDKSGAVVDTGKYVTVYAKKNGKWLIIRDIWNSDGPMQMVKTN